jgi:hypothetical protein
MASGAPPKAVQDLVEITSERRLRNAFEAHWLMMYDFPGDAYYREWQLRADTNALVRIVESSDVADRLFPFLLNDDPQTRIVWLSETHHLLCEGPNDYRDDASLSWFLDDMNCHGGEMVLDLLLRDSSTWYHVVMDNFVGTLQPGSNQREFEEAPDLVTLLLQMTARDARIGHVQIEMRHETTVPVAGLEYLRSTPNGPRVETNCKES